MHFPIRPQNYIPFILVALFFTVVSCFGLFKNKPEVVAIEQPAHTVSTSPNTFEGLSLEARSVYVFDLNNNNVLYARNAEIQLPLASLSKVMTALVALDYAPGDTVITLRREFLKNEGDQGLLPGERWRLKDIVDFTLVMSSNDGAGALASVVASRNGSIRDGAFETDAFVSAMNAKARELGLSQTYFVNETGLDPGNDLAGGYGSARDVAHLFAHALRSIPGHLEATRYRKLKLRSLDNVVHTAINTDPLVQTIPGMIASKTGLTDLAGGNLTIAFDAGLGKPIVIALLGSSQNGRFRDMEKLVAATLASLQ